MSLKSISFDRTAPRPGFFIRTTDSITISTKTGVDINGLAMLLESNPLNIIITDAKPGGKHGFSGEDLEPGTTINCLVPSGVHAQFNEFDINVRTARGRSGVPDPHKSLTVSRCAGQSLIIVRNPEFSALEAAQDLKTNGIQILSPNVGGNRMSRVTVKATGMWMVVRSELYNPATMNNSSLTHYRGLLVTTIDVPGSNECKFKHLTKLLARIEKAISELESMNSSNDEISQLVNGFTNKQVQIKTLLQNFALPV